MSTITTGKVIIYKPNFNVNPVDTLLDLPVLGAENTLYVIKDTGAIYLWNGSEFIIYDSRPYKVYTALLTQTGTDAPVATVLENTLGGVPVWSYSSLGTYHTTLLDTFTINKTYTSVNIETVFDVSTENKFIRAYQSSNDYIEIQVSKIDYDGGFNSGGLTNDFIGYIEIRVYP